MGALPNTERSAAATSRAQPAPPTGFVDLARAVARWRAALGESAVIVGQARRGYENNCIAVTRSVPVALRPTTTAEVQDIVRIARDCRVPIYPISTGNNWGYGGSTPLTDRCVVVDLSAMNRIISVEPELGLAVVEPGVTQGDLREYLDQRGLQFMVPTTGAGPTCSLVGNALERGYGITPHSDHFAAVRSLRAVLPDGRLYEPALAGLGGVLADGGHKWGVGPYLDGLFSQGGFGIVTEMTIALAPLPDEVQAFLVDIKDESLLEPVVDEVRDLIQRSGGGIGGVNLMNRLRLLSMFHSYPREDVVPGNALSGALVESLGNAAGLPTWMGLGALYGDREVVTGLRHAVRRRLKKHSTRIRFISKRSLAGANWLGRNLPGRLGRTTAKRAQMASELLDILSGRPKETALRLAYWKSSSPPPADQPMDPVRDGCGIIWFAPLVPMRARDARTYVNIVNEVCPSFGIDPLITLTTVTEQCFDSTVPILYSGASEAERAHECYDALFDACQSHGFLPYRMNVRSMPRYTEMRNSSYWDTVQRLKSALDPDNLISPGRYAPLY